jgi:hypothetical protein
LESQLMDSMARLSEAPLPWATKEGGTEWANGP